VKTKQCPQEDVCAMDIRYKFCRKSFGTDAASQISSQEFVVNLAENGL